MTGVGSDSTRKQTAPAGFTTSGSPVDLVLTAEQNWAAKSHRELYDSVHRDNDPGQTGEIGSRWARFGTGLAESARIIGEELATTESGWTGVSADKARTAIGLLAQWVAETGRKATELGDRVQEQSRIMATARAAMPEPVGFDWNAATGELGKPGLADFAASAADVHAANEKSRAAHDQAVTVMKEMEQQSRTVDQTTPRFTAPFNPATGQVEELRPMTSHFAGGPSSGASPLPSPVGEPTGGVPHQAGGSAPGAEPAVRTAAAVAGTPGVPVGPGSPALPEHQAPAAQHVPGQGVTAAAAAATVAPGTHAPPNVVHRPAGSGKPGSPVHPGALPVAPGPKQPAKAPPKQLGRSGPTGTPPAPTRGTAVDPVRSAPPAATGTGGPGGGGGRAGFAGGGSGVGAPPGPAGGQPKEDNVVQRPGGSTGLIPSGDRSAPTNAFGPNAAGVVGASASKADGTPMGGAPPPMGGARSPGAEDGEHKSAYVQSGDIFDVPGDELPPSVIGGPKSPKTGGQQS